MSITKRERLLAVIRGEIPDCVPVCPDISNMVPCRLTGKPFWDIYVYRDPPLWKAHINALKRFDLDGGWELYDFGDLFGDQGPAWEAKIVLRREDGSFVTQDYCAETGEWSRWVTVHTCDNPPATHVRPAQVGLSAEPRTWEDIRGVRQWPAGMALWQHIKAELGDHGVIGMWGGGTTAVLGRPEDIYDYYDYPEKWHRRRDELIERVEHRMELIAALDEKPDFIFCGGSGSLVFQSPRIFRELALPILKRTTELAYDLGLPTHVHSCGPEKLLVQMAAEETKLTVIDPLEVAPMGDCDLAELKQRFGDKIVLKGNLHTSATMLAGTVDDVVRASRKAIDDAAAGGRFILSTGDQCGRDTPDANIYAMVETARTYGRY
jgi:uroporphyrinogen decarboxylase